MINTEEIKCQFCGSDKNLFHGFISMALPDTDMEKKKEKYGAEWWKAMERTDLTEEENKELEQLNLYDQMINTVGRGTACQECLNKEDGFYKTQ